VLFERGDSAVGYALFRKGPEWIYLRQFFVDTQWRRGGIGRFAIEWLRNNAWQDSRIRVEVLIHNQAGIAFWRAVGFADYALTMESDPHWA
jgi:predicted acetyltransferase